MGMVCCVGSLFGGSWWFVVVGGGGWRKCVSDSLEGGEAEQNRAEQGRAEQGRVKQQTYLPGRLVSS